MIAACISGNNCVVVRTDRSLHLYVAYARPGSVLALRVHASALALRVHVHMLDRRSNDMGISLPLVV